MLFLEIWLAGKQLQSTCCNLTSSGPLSKHSAIVETNVTDMNCRWMNVLPFGEQSNSIRDSSLKWVGHCTVASDNFIFPSFSLIHAKKQLARPVDKRTQLVGQSWSAIKSTCRNSQGRQSTCGHLRFTIVTVQNMSDLVYSIDCFRVCILHRTVILQ